MITLMASYPFHTWLPGNKEYRIKSGCTVVS